MLSFVLHLTIYRSRILDRSVSCGPGVVGMICGQFGGNRIMPPYLLAGRHANEVNPIVFYIDQRVNLECMHC